MSVVGGRQSAATRYVCHEGVGWMALATSLVVCESADANLWIAKDRRQTTDGTSHQVDPISCLMMETISSLLVDVIVLRNPSFL